MTVSAAVREVVEVLGFRSGTNRALVLSAFADGPLTVTGALESRDYDLMADALRAFGMNIKTSGPGELRIMPLQRFRGAPGGIGCGLAGTVIRFVLPLVALADSPTRFYGDPQATTRPMSGLLDGLRQLGAGIGVDSLPFTLVSELTTSDSEVMMDSSTSNQFVSGLLLIGARPPSGLRLRHAGDSLPSRPHIAMTVETLRAYGVRIDESDVRSRRVHSGPVLPLDVHAEPGLTNALVFLAAGAAASGCAMVPSWPGSTLQPGARFLDVAERMGRTTTRNGEVATFSSPGRLCGIDVDLYDASELTPVVAALTVLAEETTRITGIAHIRSHEIDRLSAFATEFRKLGVAVIEYHGGLEIMGGSWGRGGVELSSYADHRMMHLVVIVALDRPGTGVDDLVYVSKIMPDFPQFWNQLVTT